MLSSGDENLKILLKDILEKMAKSSSEDKKDLFNKIKEAVDDIDIDSFNLLVDDKGFQKPVNRKNFMEFIESAFEKIKPEDITKEVVEIGINNALKSVDERALANEVNKDLLDKLGDAFKRLSTNEKIVVGSFVAAVAIPLLPFIALAALIALVSIGARYAGKGVIKVGEMIKEGAKAIEKGVVKTGKEVKGSYKNFVDNTIPTLQPRESHFGKFYSNLSDSIDGLERSGSKEEGIISTLTNTKKVLNMLQGEEQQSAIKELIKDGTIKDFSEGDMKRLMEKGRSTHTDDRKAFEDLIETFETAIMTIGDGTIDDVIKTVNNRVNEMKQSQNQNQSPATPSPDLTNPSTSHTASLAADKGVSPGGK